MNSFVEQLETRRLMAVVYNPSGSFSGVANPVNHPSAVAIMAVTGIKKGTGRVDAAMDLNIASNSVVTGALELNGVATYVLSGMVVGADVSMQFDLNGMAVGTLAGKLKSLNKKLIGPFTDTVNGTVIHGRLNLTNDASTHKKSSTNSQDLALAPGYYPNETPPPITSGIAAGTSAGNEAGVTGGNNSGTGTIDSGGGSVLG